MDSWKGGPECPPLIKDIIEFFWNDYRGYQSLPHPFVFEGTLYPSAPGDLDPWGTQTSRQHEHLYYLWMSGVSLDVINRSFLPLQLALPPDQLEPPTR